jgi:membrane fusion protein (multidrug efflux system)
VIKGGVTENDKILLEGIRKVQDGNKIAFEYEEPSKVMSQLKLESE